MSQPSVAHYFNNRKRSALDEKVVKAKKVLVLDSATHGEDKNILFKKIVEVGKPSFPDTPSATREAKLNVPKIARRKLPSKKAVGPSNQRSIKEVLGNMAVKSTPDATSAKETDITQKTPESVVNERHVTPPSTPTKVINRLDNVKDVKELSLKEIRQRLSRSHRLAELRASIARFKESSDQLEKAEEATAKVADSPTLKNFKKLEFEVNLSPSKIFSPEKAYLSPKKDPPARKNLFSVLSPSKTTTAIAASPQKDLLINVKPSLTLPYKYRTLAEIFRSIDTVCQILYNRKEVITFRKLKPAVEEMLKKNLTEKHLGQIKALFEDAFKFTQEKLRVFAAGKRQEQWELVLTPIISQEAMTSEVLLERRRKLFNVLIDKTKHYHNEFLLTLDPPVQVSKDKITRWHPEFNIEKVPDIEPSELPQPPDEIKLVSGKEVLEKAKQMFNCNSRMEEALARLEERKKQEPQLEPKPVESVLKGIPKALLEKVRQRQAAKALMSITRSEETEKEIQKYMRLPEIARVTRGIFVAEKKGVLPLSVVVDKLQNSFRCFLTGDEVEEHLRLISKEVPDWLIFHDVRHSLFVKLSKNADLTEVVTKLNKILEEKSKS